jgi:peptide/nickel transport system substrate-binding protein
MTSCSPGAYCTAPGGGCAQATKFTGVKSVEALDPLTVKVTFTAPKPYPYQAFVGATSPYPSESAVPGLPRAEGAGMHGRQFRADRHRPVQGQGVQAERFDHLCRKRKLSRPDKPAFASIALKGGGDALSAARAVLETGEYDYGWNIQIEPEVLKGMVDAGKGKALTAFGTYVERIDLNRTAVDPALGDKRSTLEGGPHPAMSDPAVRKALNLAIDRDVIVETGYGVAGKPTCNIIPGPEVYVSTTNDWCLKPDVAAANKLLDDAGWKMGADGVRAKNGVKLSFQFQTSTNSVRQATQALLKDMWGQIGVAVELRNIAGLRVFRRRSVEPGHVPEVLR